MLNNDDQNNKKWVPYFKRENSIYQKHPFLAWTITIIIIVGALYLVYNSVDTLKKNTDYNAGYESFYYK